MASQKQSYRAGEAKGQAEEKTSQMFDKTRQTKDDTATRQTKDDTASYVSDKAGAAKDKATQMGRSTKETAEAGKEKTGGVIQRTSEQVKNMAQGAAEKVKDTFGMAGNGEEVDDDNQMEVGGDTAGGATTTTTTRTARKN